MVNIFDIKVEKKKTNDNSISNFKKVKNNEKSINLVISISLINNTIKNNNDCKAIISIIQRENQKNFQIINSYLLIGFDKIKNIVFHSISLNSNWLHTNKTLKNQNISIIASQKSTTTLLSSQIVNFHKEIEKIINTKAKKTIKYKNLFLVISLNVFNAIFNIKIKLKNKLWLWRNIFLIFSILFFNIF